MARLSVGLLVALAGCNFGLTVSKVYDSAGGQDSRGPAPDEEVCDGVDNDGDGRVDEGYDEDRDGYTSCGSGDGGVDCDDTDPNVNPAASETAGNGVDDDCDGVIDDGTWSDGDLLLTEVLYAPLDVGDAVGEWIEVYNPTSRSLDLSGLRMVGNDGEFTISSSVPVAAGASVVLAVSGERSTNGGVTADYVYRGLALGDAADELTLYAGDTVLDTVYWDDGATMPRAMGASLMVDPGAYGQSAPRYWCAATEAWAGGDKGSPGEVNELCSTIDHDGDGYTGDDGDCDDANEAVHPGAESPDSTIDWDCDGVRNGTPTAVAGSSGSAYACDPIQLDGTGSSDPDGDRLSYDWTLVSAPMGSTATTSDLNTPTSVSPTLYADVQGDYRFSLTVSDAVSSSAASTVTVTAGRRPNNAAPTANAGRDQSQASSANCTPIAYGTAGYDCDACPDLSFALSAGGSTDGDGDELTYNWTVTSGGRYASLSAAAGVSTNVTVSGVTAFYGSATVQDVVVTLTVTDCMGASTTDTVTVSVSCAGY